MLLNLGLTQCNLLYYEQRARSSWSQQATVMCLPGPSMVFGQPPGVVPAEVLGRALFTPSAESQRQQPFVLAVLCPFLDLALHNLRC